MKLFFFQWPVDVPAYLEALVELESSGHRIVYFVYSGDPTEAKKRLPRALFHKHERALDGIAPKELLMHILPPDAALVRKMAGVESAILSMMNKHYDWMTVDERKQTYYNMLGFWHQVLLRYTPDALVFPAVPHSVYDYLCYELARLLRIRTILFDYTLVGDRYLSMNDFRVGSEAVVRAFARLASERVEAGDLSREMREYYTRLRTGGEANAPLYVSEDRKKYSRANVWKIRARIFFRSVKDKSVLQKSASFFGKFFGDNIKREYRSVSAMPDWNAPFVYVPLNYQPECTTSPQGDIFVAQTLMIEILSAALPFSWRLYVKEHQSQWGPRGLNFGSSRYRGYYRRIARIPQATLVPLEVPSHALIARSLCVATVSGTAAWEALLRQKPAIIFGHPWYQNAPGLLRADSVASCRKCFARIESGLAIREEDNIRFLKALEETTVHGHFQEYARRHSFVEGAESARAVSRVIAEALAS